MEAEGAPRGDGSLGRTECLLFKQGDLSSDPQHLLKMPGCQVVGETAVRSQCSENISTKEGGELASWLSQ